MTLVPFFLDFSKKAKLIRMISDSRRNMESLIDARENLIKDVESLPYNYLDEIITQSERAIEESLSENESIIIKDLHRASLWRLQRIHIEQP